MTNSITAAQLDGLLRKNDRPVVIAFSSSKFISCRLFDPVFMSVADTLGDKAYFALFDTDSDDGRALSARYGVQLLPTVLVCSGNMEMRRVTGMMNAQALTALVEGL